MVQRATAQARKLRWTLRKWNNRRNQRAVARTRGPIYDDYGDNHATIQCDLEPGHDGDHHEVFYRYGKPVTITWEVDEDNPLPGK